MGTFGHKIFQDDFALDIRDLYLEKLFDGQTNEQATAELILENKNADIDEKFIFWLSLAATQWEYGRLLEQVKNKAIEIIDSGDDLKNYDGDKKRAKELAYLKSKLLSVQPKEKKLIKRKINIKSGDVFTFKTDTKNFAFGRVLNESYIAIYLFKSSTNTISIEEIIKNKVAFVIGTTGDGFYTKKWKIIGNEPLENFFTEPIYFFHVPLNSDRCTVFNIWEDWSAHKIIPESQCEKMTWGYFGIEQWSSFSTPHIIERLNAKLENRAYQNYLPENWETLHFRKFRID
jgi:hypothetical protein